MAQLKRRLFSYDIETMNPLWHLWHPTRKQLSFFFLDEVKNMPHDNTQVKIDLLRKQISALDFEMGEKMRNLFSSLNKLELEVKTVRETAKPLSPFSMTLHDLQNRIWRTSDGREIEFSKLVTPHLKNCIEYCYDVLRERNGNFPLVRSYLNFLTKEYAMRQDR